MCKSTGMLKQAGLSTTESAQEGGGLTVQLQKHECSKSIFFPPYLIHKNQN